MALVIDDRVQETSTTTGTGTLTLAGAVSGYRTFSGEIGNGNTTYYVIWNTTVATEFETGLGTVAAGTLARTTVFESSNAGAAVNFSAGTKLVFCALLAGKTPYVDTQATEMQSPIIQMNQNVTADHTIPATRNALSAGPVTIDSGKTVTVSSGAVWTIV
mgnify:CR=1 FL=1